SGGTGANGVSAAWAPSAVAACGSGMSGAGIIGREAQRWDHRAQAGQRTPQAAPPGRHGWARCRVIRKA
ncbi:MAG: hypothetical protein MI924_13830, partial [Chloroflexales bacterium]|nr:hypothetical protein [Chloroflexales bacterium]